MDGGDIVLAKLDSNDYKRAGFCNRNFIFLRRYFDHFSKTGLFICMKKTTTDQKGTFLMLREA